ncbi:hypothetical protein FIBSPDRAFT_892307 [Athelia psychrophila]|uniref:Uncharacterized protein n=1 Tax=Athelia psychrophila TaxID=1759441 RepID=A0A166IK72_9AGAM|nr:hypothetical protein FIBSPDRAFT_892307 [Fibularhizoctonia sp. CBS 109695]
MPNLQSGQMGDRDSTKLLARGAEVGQGWKDPGVHDEHRDKKSNGVPQTALATGRPANVQRRQCVRRMEEKGEETQEGGGKPVGKRISHICQSDVAWDLPRRSQKGTGLYPTSRQPSILIVDILLLPQAVETSQVKIPSWLAFGSGAFPTESCRFPSRLYILPFAFARLPASAAPPSSFALLAAAACLNSDDRMRPVTRNYTVNTYRSSAIQPEDARVLVHKPPWVYTSPNLSVIPFFDPQPTELRARHDGRFGMEDYVSHPQGYSETFPWAPLIPRQPTTTDALRAHPYTLCWYNLIQEDWVAPIGCAFTGVGTLELAPYTEMYVLAVSVNTRAVSLYAGQSVPHEMVTVARTMFSVLEPLKSLPLGFRDLVLQWTQVQHLLLDLVAMESYYAHFLSAMMQQDQRHQVNLNLLGCFSTNPAVVDNMYWAGVPVVYVRTEEHPNAWNIRTLAILPDFWYPPDVETKEWSADTPCRTLWLASHGTDRIRMSRPFGQYFEDIPALPSAPSSQPGYLFPAAPPPATAPTPQYDNPLPDNAFQQRSPSPPFQFTDSETPRSQTPPPGTANTSTGSSLVPSGGVVKLSRRQKKQQSIDEFLLFREVQAMGSSQPQRVYTPTQQPKFTRAINRNKWKPTSSPMLPTHPPQWADALGKVDTHAEFKNLIPREECGTMFPDPGYFGVISHDKLRAAIAAWLYTRPSRCGQILHPFQGSMPVANSATWRKFFYIYAYRWPELADTPGEDPQPGQLSPDVVEHVADALEAAKAMFGPELVAHLRLENTEVYFHGIHIPVVKGRAQHLTQGLVQRITWELAELNWRYELLALDQVIARVRWRTDDDASERMEHVKDVFLPGRDLVFWNTPFSTVTPAITEVNIVDRLPAILALHRLMLSWLDCPDVLQCVFPKDAPRAAMIGLERLVLRNYCQTFYVHFGRPPIIPLCMPKYSLSNNITLSSTA